MRFAAVVITAAGFMVAAPAMARAHAKAETREVRVLDADDPNLLPVLRAAAK